MRKPIIVLTALVLCCTCILSGQVVGRRDIPKKGIPEPTIMRLGNIAYRISKTELANLISSEAFNTANGTSHGYNLLGIQIEFKNSAANGYNDYLNIRQLYFNPTNQQFKIFPEDHVSNPHYVQIRNDKAHEISNSSSQPGYKLEIQNTHHIFPKIYERLDFYDLQESIRTGFVYFSVDQLLLLEAYYETIIISGAQTRYGRTFTDEPDDRVNQQTLLFTLKMEGETKSTISMSNCNPEAVETSGEIDIPLIAYGHPCPPTWQSFTIILDQIFSDIDPNEVRCVFRNWYGTVRK